MRLPGPILHEMMKHALETGDEECCGLIVGDRDERYRHLHRCHNEMTARHNEDPLQFPRDNRSAFYIGARDLDAVLRESERSGMHVTAVYHSHVGAAAYLSEMDRAYAEHTLTPLPDADWIVLAVLERERKVSEVALFRRGTTGFEGHPVPIPSALA